MAESRGQRKAAGEEENFSPGTVQGVFGYRTWPLMGDDAEIDGDGRLRSGRYGDVYFSGDGVPETEHVFLRGNGLAERFAEARGVFVVGETGFGTGLNFLMAVACFAEHAQPGARLVFVSTELHPLAQETLGKAHAQLPEKLQALALELREALGRGDDAMTFVDGRVTLHVLRGDATESLRSHTFAADAWFLDGFSPSKNPAMWSFELLREVANHTAVDGTFATYTVAGHVRRSLQDAGFVVERAAGHGKKREMLRGTRKAFAKASNTARLATCEQPVVQRVHVLGAGIAGATIANALARRGVAVSVIDPNGIAAGASGIAAAIMRPRLWKAGTRTPDAEMLAQAFRFTSQWLAGNEHFRQCGAMICAADEADAQRLQQRTENPATADLATWCAAAEATAIAGSEVPHGGAWVETAGTCDLRQLSEQLLRHERIEVRPDLPSDAATVTVLATGTAPDCATQPVRGQAIAVAWPDQVAGPKTVLCTAGYLSPPTADGTTWLGSTFDRDDEGTEERDSDDARIRGHFAGLAQLSVQLHDLPAKLRFAAVRNTTSNRLPLIGCAGDNIASLAHGSRGAVTAPWAADLLVRHAFGKPLPLSMGYWQRLSPTR